MATITRVFLRNRARALLKRSSLRKVLLLLVALGLGYLCAVTFRASSYVEQTSRTGHKASTSRSKLNTALFEKEKKIRVEDLHLSRGAHVIDEADLLAKLKGRAAGENVLPIILLLYDTDSWNSANAARVFLESQRVLLKLHRHYAGVVPSLTTTSEGREIGRYSMIVTSSAISVFHEWSEMERRPYMDYCRKYAVPLVLLMPSSNDETVSERVYFANLSVIPLPPESILRLSLNSSHEFRYARPGRDIISHTQRDEQWFGFETRSPDKSNLNSPLQAQPTSQSLDRSPIATATRQHSVIASAVFTEFVSVPSVADGINTTVAVAIQDTGLHDGVVKMFLSSPLKFWLSKLLLLDTIRSLAVRPLLRFGHERWVMVDIDDMFVAPNGSKMVPEDVEVRVCPSPERGG